MLAENNGVLVFTTDENLFFAKKIVDRSFKSYSRMVYEGTLSSLCKELLFAGLEVTQLGNYKVSYGKSFDEVYGTLQKRSYHSLPRILAGKIILMELTNVSRNQLYLLPKLNEIC